MTSRYWSSSLATRKLAYLAYTHNFLLEQAVGLLVKKQSDRELNSYTICQLFWQWSESCCTASKQLEKFVYCVTFNISCFLAATSKQVFKKCIKVASEGRFVFHNTIQISLFQSKLFKTGQFQSTKRKCIFTLPTIHCYFMPWNHAQWVTLPDVYKMAETSLTVFSCF